MSQSNEQQNDIVAVLGIDPNRIGEFQQAVLHNTFFDKLASADIVPQTEEQAQKLCVLADQLRAVEQKRASMQTGNAIDNAWNVMMGVGAKQANAPEMVRHNLSLEIADKTASFLSNPEMFAYALGTRAIQRQAAG